MQHVMVDIETLGTGPDAVIKSLGAVDFDPQTGEIGTDCFHQVVELNDTDFVDGSVTSSTLDFWIKQDGLSKDIFKNRWDDLPLMVVLGLFHKWWEAKGAKYVWAYAPSFDCVILEHWFKKHKFPCPWSFRNSRCVRTTLDLASVSLKDYHNEIKHNALFDADTQARAIIAAYEKLGLVKGDDNVDSRTEVS